MITQHVHVSPPASFHHDFVRAAYKTLPRRLFLQYMASESFAVDEVWFSYV